MDHPPDIGSLIYWLRMALQTRTRSSKVELDDLPAELHVEILSLLQPLELAMIARTRKAYYKFAEQLLWKHVELLSFKQIRCFHYSLQRRINPQYREEAVLDATRFEEFEWTGPDRVIAADYYKLANKRPLITTLRSIVITLPEFDFALLQELVKMVYFIQRHCETADIAVVGNRKGFILLNKSVNLDSPRGTTPVKAKRFRVKLGKIYFCRLCELFSACPHGHEFKRCILEFTDRQLPEYQIPRAIAQYVRAQTAPTQVVPAPGASTATAIATASTTTGDPAVAGPPQTAPAPLSVYVPVPAEGLLTDHPKITSSNSSWFEYRDIYWRVEEATHKGPESRKIGYGDLCLTDIDSKIIFKSKILECFRLLYDASFHIVDDDLTTPHPVPIPSSSQPRA